MMRTITTTIEAYKLDELSESGKSKAIQSLYDINVDFDWWAHVYEDAKRVGMRITGFDVDRGSFCDLEFIDSGEEVARSILDTHGETCLHDTGVTREQAKLYITARDTLILECQQNWEGGELIDEDALDSNLDELDELYDEFKKAMSEEYLSMLSQEYDYLTSEEAIINAIESNGYEFTEEGELI